MKQHLTTLIVGLLTLVLGFVINDQYRILTKKAKPEISVKYICIYKSHEGAWKVKIPIIISNKGESQFISEFLNLELYLDSLDTRIFETKYPYPFVISSNSLIDTTILCELYNLSEYNVEKDSLSRLRLFLIKFDFINNKESVFHKEYNFKDWGETY